MKKILGLTSCLLVLGTQSAHALTHCLSNLEKLTEKNVLNLTYCGLKDNASTKLAAYLETHTEIDTIDYSGNTMGPSVAGVFNKDKNLKSLNLERNQLTDATLAILLQDNKSLVDLNLSDNLIDDEGAILLAKNKQFKRLSLSNNYKLTNVGANTILSNLDLEGFDLSWNPNLTGASLQGIKVKTHLVDLNLEHDYQIGEEALLEVAKSTTIKILNFSWLEFEPNSQVLKALAANETLNVLFMNGNRIADNDAKILANNRHIEELFFANSRRLTGVGLSFIASIPTLKKINMEYNEHLDDRALQALANNKNLTSINVMGSKFGNDAQLGIAKLPKLVSLNLSYVTNENLFAELAKNTNLNQLILHAQTSKGADALIENKSINELHLTFDDSVKVDSAFFKALKKNTTLKNLSLKIYNLSKLYVEQIANNSTLEVLDLSYSDIGDAGAKFLVDNKTLKSLILRSNGIHDKVALRLAASKTLQELDLSANPLTAAGMEEIIGSSSIIRLDVNAS